MNASDRESVLALLRQAGYSKIESIQAVVNPEFKDISFPEGGPRRGSRSSGGNSEPFKSRRRCYMSAPKRVSAQEVRGKLQSGGQVLLVCAYESDVKFRQAALDGAVPFSEFESRKASLPSDLEIVFY